MKYLLPRRIIGLLVAAVATASFASAATQTCRDVSFLGLGVPLAPETFNTTLRAPFGSGTCNTMASSTTVSGVSNNTVHPPSATRYFYTLRTDLLEGPASFAQPRASGILLNANGDVPLSVSGIQCPSSVDNTVGNGPGTQVSCQVFANTSSYATGFRIIHARLN